MTSQILSIVQRVLTQTYDWVWSFLLPFWGWVFTTFTIFTVCRFILFPLLGSVNLSSSIRENERDSYRRSSKSSSRRSSKRG